MTAAVDHYNSAIIIQARMSSSRFPGKMMKELYGTPLVHYVYMHCKSSHIKKVLVATSRDSTDDVLYEYCINNNVAIFRGDLDDVIGRFIEAALSINAQYIIRVCGDTPFVDIELLERFLELLIREKLDYVSADRSTCAPAFYSEAVSLAALNKVYSSPITKQEREHVTKYIIDHKDKFLTKFLDVGLNPEYAKKACVAIDSARDLVLANKLIQGLPDKCFFTAKNILDESRKIEVA